MKTNSNFDKIQVEYFGGDIDLIALLATFWRGKIWIALSTTVALAIGGYLGYFAATPKYTSQSVVVLEENQSAIVDFASVVSGVGSDQAAINTEVEVIRSRTLMGKLVDELNLIEDPEFNAALRPAPKFSVGAVLQMLGAGGEGRPKLTDAQTQNAVIDNVLKTIFVSNVRQSFVFKITVTTQSPEKSALISNTLAELYIKEQIAVKFAGTEQATEWLSGRVAELKVELETTEAAAKSFASETDLVSVEALEGLNKQIKDLRDRREDLLSTVDDTKILIAIQSAAREKSDFDQMVLLTGDRLLEREVKKVKAGDPTAIEIFLSRFDALVARSEAELARSDTQLFTLDQTIARIEGQVAQQSDDLVELQQLQREAEANRLIYEYFLGRLKETSVQQGIQQADGRILSLAVAPNSPSAPRQSLILALSAVLGAMAGAGLVLLRELRNNSIRTSTELEKLTGVSVIGQIPRIPTRKRSNVLKYLVNKPNSAAAEAIRNLRTSVLLSDIDNPPQIIMSTSSLPGEGKTTQSLALAQNFSGLGQKVLLIEGDIRRRVFSEYFDITDKKGLLSVLSGDEKLKDAVAFVDQLGADVLIGEKSNTNAADVFTSKSFQAFVNNARKEYDVIIIDTPPVLVVPDARVIGQSVDAIIYTVKWDTTTKTQVREGLKMFEQVNLKVSGLVLGQIDTQGMKNYGYGGAYGSNYYHE